MTQVAAQDLDWLARVAEGRAADVPQESIERLCAAGLVAPIRRVAQQQTTLELTPAGLAHIRSSDQ